MAINVYELNVTVGEPFEDEIVITTDFYINVVDDVSVPSWITDDSYPNNNYAYAISGTAPSEGTYTLIYRVRDVWGNVDQQVSVLIHASEKTVPVTRISFSGIKQFYSNSEGSCYATAYPTNATDRRISISKGTGSSYFSILSTELQSDGGYRVALRLNSTSVERSCSIIATAMDGSGVTKEFDFTIIPEEDPTVYVRSISLSASNTRPVVGEATTIYATCSPSNADDTRVEWSIDSGAAEIPGVVGLRDLTIGCDTAGTSVIRATARDGGGATRTISITWVAPVDATSISLSGLDSMSGYDGAVEVLEGEQFEFTATVYPTNTDDTLFSNENSSHFGVSVRQTGSQIGTSTYTVRVSGHSAGEGSFRLYAGNIEKVIHVTVTAKTLVESIQFSPSAVGYIKPGEEDGPYHAYALPYDADNRAVSVSVQSGSQFADLEDVTPSDTGCRFNIRAKAAGTAVIRAVSSENSAIYKDLQVEVVDYIPAAGLQLSNATIYVDYEAWIYARNVKEEGAVFTITDGAEHVQIVDTADDHIVVKGISAGEFTVHAVTTTGSYEDTRTYKVIDEIPSDSTEYLTYYLDAYTTATLSVYYVGYRLHGGRYDVTLPAGIEIEGQTVIPKDSDSNLHITHTQYPCTGTELGQAVIYAEEVDPITSPEIVKIVVQVVHAGEWTKKVHFDANLPAGYTLTSPVPDDIVAENTGDFYQMELPTQTPAVDGLMFLFWEDRRPGGTIYFPEDSPILTLEGEDMEVTLYAAWFRLSDLYSVQKTRYGTVEVGIPLTLGQEAEVELPLYADVDPDPSSRYPVQFDSYGPIDGVLALVGGADITGSTATASSGTLTLSGTPVTSGQTASLYSNDARFWSIVYNVTVGTGSGGGSGTDIVLDANGGTFPSGRSLETVVAPDGSYVLPDWSVVDRPGYRLSHWTGSAGNRAEMGSVQTVVDTWTARWTQDSRGYSTAHLPHAAVRIHRTLDEFIDATYLQEHGGEVVVDIAEDRPGMATMTLKSDIRNSSRNLMSEDCSLWSSGPDGPIRPGMYVRIDSIEADVTLLYLMDGFITTISPNAEQVGIEVGDRISFLARQGTTLRRNYYGGAGNRSSDLVSAGFDGTDLYADLSELPTGAVPDGTIYWTVPAQKVYSGTVQRDGASVGDGGLIFEWTFPAEGAYLRGVTIGMYFALFGTDRAITFTAVLTSTAGSRVEVEKEVTISNGDFDLSFDFGMAEVSGTCKIAMYSTAQGGQVDTRTIATPQSSGNCTYSYWYGTGSNRRWVTVRRDVTSTLDFYARVAAEGEVVGDKFVVSTIGSMALSDSSLYTPSEDRVYIPYVLSGVQSTVEVMQGIAWALGITPMVNTSVLPADDTQVAIFRTGGGYAQDYLQKLADIASDSGRRRAYLCRGFTTPVLAVGARYGAGDGSLALLHYGGDNPSGTGARIAFSSFTPSMTLKNRPSLATLRGTISTQGSTESTPLQIAVEDVDSTEARFGVLVETVVADSSIASMGDAGNSAWAALAENDLNQWEGSMILPGIRADLMALSGPYVGSGVPVRITDSRNGLDDYSARIRQVKMDFNACTTTVTLSNYSIIHSSGIADTTALAITSADVATGDNSTTLFNSQYVRVKTDVDQNIGSGTNVTVSGRFGSTGATFPFPSVSVFELPNGRHLIHAVITATDQVHAEDDAVYDVVAVQVGDNPELAIRPSVRPDLYQGQTLSVDIDCP